MRGIPLRVLLYPALERRVLLGRRRLRLVLRRFALLVDGDSLALMATESSLDEWRHCPRCGGDLDRGRDRVRCPACGLVVYANPAPTASALVLGDDGRVLLARRASEPRVGLWDVIGGFMDEGESPVETLRREVKEETGLEIEPDEFVGGFPDRYGEAGIYTINFYWTVRVVSGEPNAADDVAELAWFHADALPAPDEFAFPNSVEALRAWRRK